MVNNAGIATENMKGPQRVDEMSIDDMDLTYSINIRGVFLGCKYAAKQFLKQEPRDGGDRGWIINLASVLGLVALQLNPTRTCNPPMSWKWEMAGSRRELTNPQPRTQRVKEPLCS
jgi:NAD(P)-dependent dehydrogenase (short-subunit alcohol dehydrogenase family)